MHTGARKRILLALLLILAALIVLPVWLVNRQIRQERLNQNLIGAIEKNDTAKALALLNAGADANAQDTREAPVSVRQVLREWWDRLRGRKSAGSALHSSALIVASTVYDWDDSKVKPAENVALFQALLDHGADPNARDEHGDTALMYAAYRAIVPRFACC